MEQRELQRPVQMSEPKTQVSIIKMYAAREEIYPREVSGRFATLRWLCVWLTQLVFYGLPWLNWNGRQAVLFDLTARKFYIFGIVLWPQDFIYLTLLLIICAYLLFLVTAVAGRIWCGFACPQTVYTEIFMWVERKIEGNRSARMRLDKQPPSLEKLVKKTSKHVVWGLVATWTGITFVGYFTPIHVLGQEIATLGLGPWESFWVVFYGFATYGNAGWMREQVCKYMCPYARFQSSMFDKDTLIVTYDDKRGEPRGARSRKEDANNARSKSLGDCIDCTMCVQVCPTGIDIRNGLQYECIGCAACADACDSVMEKIGRPIGLVRYATENAIKNGFSSTEIRRRALRPRVLIYTAVLIVIVIAFSASLLTRKSLKLDVIRDRGAMGREVEDGKIENVYRLQIMNTAESAHRYKISVSGIETIALAGSDEIEMRPTTSRAVPVRVRIDQGKGKKGSNKIQFAVESIDKDTDTGGGSVREEAVFFVPRN